MQRQQNLVYPVSDWELQQLKNGATSTPHWHDIVDKGDTFCAIIGLNINEDKYDYLRERGIHCLGCQIKPESIETMERGDIVASSHQVHGGVKVVVLMMMDYQVKKVANFPLNNLPSKNSELKGGKSASARAIGLGVSTHLGILRGSNDLSVI